MNDAFRVRLLNKQEDMEGLLKILIKVSRLVNE
jgi:hypothetical protein